jgi:hypothetical protein
MDSDASGEAVDREASAYVALYNRSCGSRLTPSLRISSHGHDMARGPGGPVHVGEKITDINTPLLDSAGGIGKRFTGR